ncbi:heterokaryon incompatibility protein-domain-containing protein [Phaeosphaeria sp. MPI-PUGE-AT-0046c]|nr:heterokaryon incompatibility protein-domain-containing protein [Phaeosphaeria sp. MPI-PUGE-AT-0046c]
MTSRWILSVVYTVLVCIECIHAVLQRVRSLVAGSYQRIYEFFELPDPPLPYQYHALDSSKSQIRLLQIQRRSGNVGIELCTFDFANAPEYVALSYTWGEAEPTHQLRLGKAYIVIRDNLNRFLQRYSGNEFFWIDQICIDQSKISERNSQVRLMSEIHRRCEFVLVWLDSIIYHSNAEQMLRNKLHVTQLLQNRYFNRLWVVQEVLLAPKIRVRLQATWIEWDDLREAVKLLQNDGHGLTIAQSTLALLKLRNIKPYTLESCIETFSGQDCEDFRDRVYGLMGLVKEEERVPIDYAKSTHQVYCDVVLTFCSGYTTHINALQKSGIDIRASEHHLFKLRQYVLSLLVLSGEMGFSVKERNKLRSLLKEIWTPQTFIDSKAPTVPGSCPITVVGFCSGSASEVHGELEHDFVDRHCWWYKKAGQIYYHDC